jgi:predicted nucleic acid-binding Zn ribbon protein
MNAVHCVYCGAPLTSANNNHQHYGNKKGNKATKKQTEVVMVTVIIVLIFVLVVIAGVFIMNKFNRSQSGVFHGGGGGGSMQPPSVVQSETEKPEASNNVVAEVTAQPTSTPTPTATAPAPVTPSPIPDTAQFLFDSDREYITTEYLDTKTQDEVRLILNEIYARHGYIFTVDKYRQYFSQKSWYTPKYTSAEEVESYFNDIECSNKITIVNYELAKGWR